MAAAAPEPKADTRAAYVNSINIREINPLSTEGMRINGFALMGSTLVELGNPVDELSLGRPHMFILPVICGDSPGPQKLDVELERAIADMHTIIYKGDIYSNFFCGQFPKHIKENFLATFPTERVEICPIRCQLASFASSPTNPGGVAESEPSLLLDSGASFHAVGDVSLLTDPVLFPNYMRGVAVCPDGTHLRIVGTGTLKMEGRFSIPDVCLVDGLKKNLISVSQLAEDHGLCCCFHGKQCLVMLQDGTVVGGAILRGDGLYELRFLQVAN